MAGDPVAARDALGLQGAGEAPHVVPGLGPRPRAVEVGPAPTVGVLLGAVLVEVGQVRGVGQVGHGRSSVAWVTPA